MKKIIEKWKQTNLIVKIALGIVLGAALGLAFPKAAVIGYLGTLFIGALKGIAPVLVFFLVAGSISQAGSGIGKKFRNVVFLYLFSTFVAAIAAVLISRIFPLSVTLPGVTEAGASAPQSLGAIFENLLQNVVENPFSAIANGNYLGILFWAITIGVGLKKLGNTAINQGIGNFSQALSQVVSGIIQCAPFGILGVVFSAVSTSGLSIFTSYGKLILELVGTMLFVMFVTNPLIMFLCTRENPYPLLLTCIKESAVSAFFTRSSAANIPVNMKLCEKLGLDKDFYSVSIPLGSTINMDGAAVVITIMSFTLANTLGMKISLPTNLLLAIISTLAACGASGVAGGSLLLLPMACSLLGISADNAMQMVAVGFVISVIQDSMETALNSSADVAFTATAEKMEKLKAGK